MHPFVLHPQLAADCHHLGDLNLCRVLLLDDRRYPWLVLVPRRPDLREIYELPDDERGLLFDESCRVGELMMQLFEGDKLNVAALGNLVPQLHIHHIVRRFDDPAWPGPVWGHSPTVRYADDELAERIALLHDALGPLQIS